MLNPITKLDAVNGNLPKKQFAKERVYFIKDKIDLYYFLSWYGTDDFYNDGCQFRNKENHSFVVSKGKKYARDFNNNITYDFFTFCQKILGLSFYSSLYLGNMFMNEQIAAENLSTNKPSITFDKLQQKIDDGVYFKSKNYPQLWGYLITTRKIDREVINYCLNQDLIYLERYGKGVNICFPFYDNGDFINGFEIVGTYSDIRYKSVVSAVTNSYFSFTKYYDSENIDTKLLCFESVIDLLSFVTLVENGTIDINNESLVLISLRGLSKNTMFKAKDDFAIINFDHVYCFTDNDERSYNFSTDLVKYNYYVKSPLDFLRCYKVKDWNDLLHIDFNEKVSLIGNIIPIKCDGFDLPW